MEGGREAAGGFRGLGFRGGGGVEARAVTDNGPYLAWKLGVRGRKKGNADAWARRPYRGWKMGVRGRFFSPAGLGFPARGGVSALDLPLKCNV